MTVTTEAWPAEQLTAIGAADELFIAAARADGTLRPEVTIWVVRVGDDLYVRSANGRDSAWYRHVAAIHRGRIRAGGIERDVIFEEADESADRIDAQQAEYHRKYDRYGPAITEGALRHEAQHAAWRILPLAS